MNLEYALRRHQEIFAGAYRYARQRRWQIDPMPFGTQISSAGRQRLHYDGIIARADPRLASFARANGIPLVNVWYSSSARNVPLVHVDHNRIGALAADHLRSRGFRRFAHVGYGRSLAVWLEALRRPVGVFVADDALARHLINAATLRGIDVPGDLAVVGNFNDEPFCLLAEPTISSIDHGYDRLGYRAAKLLDDLMGGQAAPAVPIVLPPRELIPRDSTDFFASDDPMVV